MTVEFENNNTNVELQFYRKTLKSLCYETPKCKNFWSRL